MHRLENPCVPLGLDQLGFKRAFRMGLLNIFGYNHKMIVSISSRRGTASESDKRPSEGLQKGFAVPIVIDDVYARGARSRGTARRQIPLEGQEP
jgi:hypothetical protein